MFRKLKWPFETFYNSYVFLARTKGHGIFYFSSGLFFLSFKMATTEVYFPNTPFIFFTFVNLFMILASPLIPFFVEFGIKWREPWGEWRHRKEDSERRGSSEERKLDVYSKDVDGYYYEVCMEMSPEIKAQIDKLASDLGYNLGELFMKSLVLIQLHQACAKSNLDSSFRIQDVDYYFEREGLQ